MLALGPCTQPAIGQLLYYHTTHHKVLPEGEGLSCRYSFDHGPIHFLQFSTEHDFSPGSEQFAWILADLKAVDRRKTPWLIAGGHNCSLQM